MTTVTTTADDIIRRYADDIAYVAEKDKDQATDIGVLADQLDTAAHNFSMAGTTVTRTWRPLRPSSPRPTTRPTTSSAPCSSVRPTNSSTPSSGT